MIYLHTGQPGAGKTLYTLHHVRERAKRENRVVYYHGIEILKPEEFPGWERFDDPERWYELPDGAIILHDECQTLYRPRGTGSKVPDCVARMETHRHKGHDIYLITQHPMLVDGNIRRLAGEHAHVQRAWGAKFAVVHRWQQVNERADKSRKDSVTTNFLYPAELFDAYKSATVHTHKAKIPKRVFAIPLLVLVAVGAGWWVVQSLVPGGGLTAGAEAVVGAQQGKADAGNPGRVEHVDRGRGPKTTEEWVAERKPRIVGLPHTAPMYDQVTQAVVAPYPAACVASASKCHCYTQQGTRMAVAEDLCRTIAETGYFVSWDTGRGRESYDRPRREVEQPDGSERSRGITVAGAGSWGGVAAGESWGGVR